MSFPQVQKLPSLLSKQHRLGMVSHHPGSPQPPTRRPQIQTFPDSSTEEKERRRRDKKRAFRKWIRQRLDEARTVRYLATTVVSRGLVRFSTPTPYDLEYPDLDLVIVLN